MPSPPLRLLCALYEAMSDPVSLDDSGVATAAAAAASAIRARGYDLGESGRFPGLYKLLAHDDAAVRAEVGSEFGLVISPMPGGPKCGSKFEFTLNPFIPS